MRTCFNCNGKGEVIWCEDEHQLLAQFVRELENVKTFVIVKPENLLNVVVVGGTTLIPVIGMGVGMSTMTNVNLNS